MLMPELMQLDMGTSTRRYKPPIGTAGFALCLVSGYSRVPAPPPRIRASTEDVAERAERGAPMVGRSMTADGALWEERGNNEKEKRSEGRCCRRAV